MQGEIRKCSGIPAIAVASTEERHQQIILSASTKPLTRFSDQREHNYGFALERLARR